jgi:hypothetical protein
VGHPLFEIETDQTASVSNSVGASVASPEKAPATVAASTQHPASDSHKSTSHRVPLIKFLGKRSEIKHNSAPAAPVAVAQAPVAAQKGTAPVTKKPSTGVDFQTLKGGAWYGRPVLTAKEMEAIESGGATEYY